MQDHDELELDKICKELLSAFKGVLSWKWDDRFETVLAEFDVANKDKVLAILDLYFRSTWDSSSIDRAPLCVKEVSNYLGDLRAGQMLFTSDTIQSVYIYCAWWPWGNGTTISVRIAPCYKTLPDPEKAEKIQQFKSLFGI
jgi:hypothetical protein